MAVLHQLRSPLAGLVHLCSFFLFFLVFATGDVELVSSVWSLVVVNGVESGITSFAGGCIGACTVAGSWGRLSAGAVFMVVVLVVAAGVAILPSGCAGACTVADSWGGVSGS